MFTHAVMKIDACTLFLRFCVLCSQYIILKSPLTENVHHIRPINNVKSLQYLHIIVFRNMIFTKLLFLSSLLIIFKSFVYLVITQFVSTLIPCTHSFYSLITKLKITCMLGTSKRSSFDNVSYQFLSVAYYDC